MPRVDVEPGLSLHYEVHGTTGPWVVLLMGLGASSRLWGKVPDELAAAGYKALTIDNRGVGESDSPRRPFLVKQMSDDAARVMDHAGIESAYVVGVSMGGMIAQRLAIDHPRRLLGLGLVSTTPGLRHAGLPHPRALRSLLAIGAGRVETEDIVADLLLAPSERHRAREVTRELAPLFAGEKARPLGFAAQLLASALHDPDRELGTIRVPTVIVSGDDDIVLPVRGSRFLARAIPGAVYEELPNTGHGGALIDHGMVTRVVDRLRAMS